MLGREPPSGALVMIEQSSDPRRNRRGRHHDRHRSVGGDKRREQAIETILAVLEADGSTARVAGHLARALSAALVLWDRCSGDAVSVPDRAFADDDLVHFDAQGGRKRFSIARRWSPTW